MLVFLADPIMYFISTSHFQYPNPQPLLPVIQILQQKLLAFLLSRGKASKNLYKNCHAVLQMHGFLNGALFLNDK